MDDFDKKCAELMAIVQHSNRVASKASPVITMAALLQESVNVNQQLCEKVTSLIEGLTNDRKGKSPDPDGKKVPGETQSGPP